MENERLLTWKECSEINNSQPSEAKYGDVFLAIAEAQDSKTLRAIGEWLDSHIMGAILKADMEAHEFRQVLNNLKQGRFPYSK